MEIPDEMVIAIFLYLPESVIPTCKMVCQGWRRIADDPCLLYYFKRKHESLMAVIVSSCEKGNILSFGIGVRTYCAFDLEPLARRSGDGSGTHDLWVKCMIAAAKGGHPDILRKVLSYGPTYGFTEALTEARRNGHAVCVHLLSENDTRPH